MPRPNFAAVARLPKDKAAEKLYPGLIFDPELPQEWVSRILEEDAFDVRPHFVWGFLGNSCMGQAVPVSQTGYDWLRSGALLTPSSTSLLPRHEGEPKWMKWLKQMLP